MTVAGVRPSSELKLAAAVLELVEFRAACRKNIYVKYFRRALKYFPTDLHRQEDAVHGDFVLQEQPVRHLQIVRLLRC